MLLWPIFWNIFLCLFMSKLKIYHRIDSEGDFRERLSALIRECFVVMIGAHIVR